jgi:hypothetical protein
MSEVNRGAPAARAMFGYAVVLVVAGIVAFMLAPEGANAITALAVPAGCALLMVLCGLMSRAIPTKYGLGMAGIHLGLVLPLVFAAVIGMRAVKTGDAIEAYREAETAWQARAEAGATVPERAAHFEAADAPDHDKSYLRNTLWFLTAASAIAFFVILARRPKKEDRGG